MSVDCPHGHGSGRGKKAVQRPRRALLVVYLLAVASLSIGWAGTDAIIRKFTTLTEPASEGRRIIWQDTVRIVRQFSLAGTGLNTYAAAMPFYRTPNPDWQ